MYNPTMANEPFAENTLTNKKWKTPGMSLDQSKNFGGLGLSDLSKMDVTTPMEKSANDVNSLDYSKSFSARRVGINKY